MEEEAGSKGDGKSPEMGGAASNHQEPDQNEPHLSGAQDNQSPNPEWSEDTQRKRLEAEHRLTQVLEQRILELQKHTSRKSRQSQVSSPESQDSGASTPIDPAEDYDMIPPAHECLRGEVGYVIKEWSEERQGWRETATEESKILADRPLGEKLQPFTWRQTKPRGRGRDHVEIIINCPTLRSMIVEQTKSWPHHPEARMRLCSPFHEIVHNWGALRSAAAGASPDDPCQGHLGKLLELIEKSKVLHYFFEQRRHFEEQKLLDDKTSAVTAFWDLDKVFYPGQLVFATPVDVPQVFLVHNCGYREFRKRPPYFRLRCWTYDFTGREFTRLHYKLSIDYFDKTKLIGDLRCYPLDRHADKAHVEQLLLDRGEKFRQYCIKPKGQQMLDYDGDVSFISRRPEDLFGEEYAQYVILGGVLASSLGKSSDSESDDNMKRAERDNDQAKRFPYKGRVIVDPGAYRLYGPEWGPRGLKVQRPDPWKECECSKCQANGALRKRLGMDYDDVRPNEIGTWPLFDRVQLLLCPPRVQGYALQKKKFVEMDVLSLHEIPREKMRNMHAFKRLVLPSTGTEWKNAKDIIQALVENHSIGNLEPGTGIPCKLEDLVEGKGQGLVILLHGVSGVGKTLTAEIVAEYTGKPLLKVSVADLGLEITQVEKKLDGIFDLASRWEAVLLFDEADVLLETRMAPGEDSSLQRNAMVSVFLKILEYYDGILLLTTNRIRAFDHAVQSRVHYAIRFPYTSAEDQREIFINFINQIPERDVDKATIIDWINSSYMEDSQFCGRQIRNIISAAMSIARGKPRRLELEDIKMLWNSTKTFNDFVKTRRLQAQDDALIERSGYGPTYR